MTDRSWVLVVPAPCEWLTANKNAGRYGQGRLIKQWREAVCMYARSAKLPKGLAFVRIDVEVRFAGRPPVRDLLNLANTFKAAVDGLGPARTFTRDGQTYHSAGYGLVADDDDKHVDGPHPTKGPPMPPGYRAGQLILTITEVLKEIGTP